MKTKEELNAIRDEVEALNEKLRELSDEEMALVAGGSTQPENSHPDPKWADIIRQDAAWPDMTRPGLEWGNILRSDPKWCDIK